MDIWERLVALFRRKANADDPEPQSKRYRLDEQARLKQGLPTLASRNIGARERGVGRNCRLALPTDSNPCFSLESARPVLSITTA